MPENDLNILKEHYRFLKDYYEYDCKLTPEGSSSSYDVYGAYIKDEFCEDMCAHVVIKEMDEKRAHIHQKLATMWNPYRANILAVHKFTDCYVAITEYASGRKLSDCYKDIDVETALDICIKLCESLEDVHRVNIIHKDIKPENIIVCNDYSKVKLIDFGASREYFEYESQNTEIIGTANYAAPEVVGIKQVDIRADIYSLGCVLNFLLTGVPPRIQMYTENKYISKIIRKATEEFRENRYQTVEQLKKSLFLAKKCMGSVFKYLPKSIPGFRSMTWWKSLIAIAFYALFTREIIVLGITGEYFTILIISIFYMIIPISIFLDLSGILKFIPIRIRKNSWMLMIIKIVLITLSIIIGEALRNM